MSEQLVTVEVLRGKHGQHVLAIGNYRLSDLRCDPYTTFLKFKVRRSEIERAMDEAKGGEE